MTLKDIADKAGVSMMTVSNVINGKHSRVSAKTIEKVNAIIKECGYVPNLSARNLTNRTSSIVGIVIPLDEDSLDENYLENPYVSAMVGTIEKELRLNGYYTMLRSVSRGQEITSLFKNWNVDGIIFLYPDDTGYINQFVESLQQGNADSPCPVAIFDSHMSVPGLINVCSDDEKGLYLSTKYMINRGHSQIAFVADYRGSHLLTQRFKGYCRALEESGIPGGVRVFKSSFLRRRHCRRQSHCFLPAQTHSRSNHRGYLCHRHHGRCTPWRSACSCGSLSDGL